METSFHTPGPPTTPEPIELVDLAGSINHPDVVRTGLTTTSNGDWALLIAVKNGTNTPIKEVEEKSSDYPVIYQEDYGSMSIARPAYPALGK